MTARLPDPGVGFPPPLLFVAAFVAGLAVERWVWRLPLGGQSARPWLLAGGWTAVVLGFALAQWGIVTFFRARTSIIPSRPARQFVTSGPYRFSRNPMYVGLTTLYLGLAAVFNLGWPVVFLPFVLWSLFALVIRREERYLASVFGDEYAVYCRNVRRWL
jgi:protein-S-isoprenylcysteine O-methyltransferase Ste14